MIETTKKNVKCLNCGNKTVKTYNITKRKWSSKFKCRKCGETSFQWFNF